MRTALRHVGCRLATCLLLAAAGASTAMAEPVREVELGRALFNGQAPLTGHLRNDTQVLPAAAVRCTNCHTAAKGREPFAPALTASTLLGLSSRRGGPPTAYSQDAFCSVLATSIDTAGVILAKTMPQYDLSDRECSALWAYLLTL